MATISDAFAIAVQHHQAGRLQSAEQIYRQILAVSPNLPEAWYLLGAISHQQGQHALAAEHLSRAIALKPDYAEAHYTLGIAFKSQGRLDEAISHYRKSLELKPGNAEAYNDLGNALQMQVKLDEAISCYRRALELKPGFAEAHNNLGFAFQHLGRLDEALECYSQTLALQPEHALAHANRALIWLLLGDWQRAWPEYEWRFRTKDFSHRRFAQSQWQGESLAGKTILLHAEQGLGDTIQFIRFAPMIKQQGATVILECQHTLLGLLEAFPGIDKLVAQKNELPEFDLQIPLMSIPGILKTSVDTIPANVPYLFPKAALIELWLKRLAHLTGFKIGISWQGNPRYLQDHFRSIPLLRFAQLARIPGVRLIGLQKGVGAEQLAEVRAMMPITDLSNDLDRETPFLDTAAVMKSLDLVITVDAVTAHLAGALGVPTWVALSHTPSWRWLLNRADSPWYPTMRLFRQAEPGNWEDVLEEMSKALQEIISRRTN
jgi:Flp pilus assembly protein TadD/ADP-heptose:LPS heptosyltransferase